MKPASFTPEELFAHTKPNGVGRIVLIQMSYYRYDNRYMLDTMERFPGVFSGVAIVDDSAPDPGCGDARARGQGRARLPHQPRRQPLSMPGSVRRAWRRCGKRPPTKGSRSVPLIGPEALPAIGKMCGRFPKTRVVIDHFARIGADGEIRDEQLDSLARLADHAHVHVKTSAFYALGKKAAALHRSRAHDPPDARCLSGRTASCGRAIAPTRSAPAMTTPPRSGSCARDSISSAIRRTQRDPPRHRRAGFLRLTGPAP
jgi:predicted TIM-barrel fold metal-dependent hydrolase